MKQTHDNRLSAAARVREPVQVYLDAAEQDRLERLRRQLSTSKSDVLRRGLEALERALVDPVRHPALRIIGLVGEEGAGGGGSVPAAGDAARDHDAFLADGEEASWRQGGGGAPAGGGSGRRARRAR